MVPSGWVMRILDRDLVYSNFRFFVCEEKMTAI